MQNFGVTNKEHYGMLWYFLECQLVYSLFMLCIHCKFFGKKKKRGKKEKKRENFL